MKVSIIIFDECTTLSSIGSYDLLSKANSFYMGEDSAAAPLFDIELVGIHRKKVQGFGGISFTVHNTIKNIEQTDLIIIPGLDDTVETGIANNKKIVPWLQKMYQQGADIASLCTGGFLLAETGLVDKRRMTTHWIAEPMFRAKYPTVNLEIDRVLIDDGRFYSSGGATSYMNLIIYLIEKYGGKELAHFCSKFFLIDKKHSHQKSYAIFSGEKDHGDDNMLEVQQFIEANYNSVLNVGLLSDLALTSRRNFIRRFKKATGNTPIEYIQRVRVEEAKRELEHTKYTINEIVNNVGYEDSPSFRRLFQKHTTLSMSQYREKYSLC